MARHEEQIREHERTGHGEGHDAAHAKHEKQHRAHDEFARKHEQFHASHEAMCRKLSGVL